MVKGLGDRVGIWDLAGKGLGDRLKLLRRLYGSTQSTYPQSEAELTDFIGERYTVLFDLLEIPVDFLSLEDWHLHSVYEAVKNSIRNLSPLNGSYERAHGLATRISTHITRVQRRGQLPKTHPSGGSPLK